MRASAAGRHACELPLALVLGLVVSGGLSAQTIGVHVGDSARVTIAPSAKVTVPVRLDLSNASGGLNIASLQANVAWGSSRLTFDSIRVVSASGFSLTSNTTNAATGSLSFNGFSASALAATGALANLYFTASATTGGTRVTIAPTAAGNELGASILAQLRMRALDVCVAPSGKWGDANNDALVNIIDAQQIARASVGLSTANPTAVADRGDVTADGNVNILDAQQIARFSVGLSAAARVGTDRFVAPAVSSVVMTPSGAQSLAIGATLALSAEARDGANANLSGCAPITWSSSAPSVAGVDANGLVTGLANGTATITAASGGQSASATVTVGSGSVTTGLRVTVTSPIGSPRYYAIVDSGGLVSPIITNHDLGNARSGSFDVAVPAGSGYRVRVVAADSLSTGSLVSSPHLAAGIRLSGVGVVSGELTALTATLQPIVVEYTPSATVAAGEAITATANITDPSELFAPITGNAAVAFYGGAPWTLDGVALGGNFLQTGSGTASTRSYSGSVFIPSESGTIRSQVEVRASFGAVLFRTYGPRLNRAEPLKATAVSEATSGVRVAISSPVAVQRFIVVVDSGTFISRGTITGTAMTSGVVTVPATPRGGYRIRVAAVDSIGQSGLLVYTTMKANGILSGVAVAPGSFTDVAVNLKLSSLTPTLPSSVTVGQGFSVGGTAVDTASLAPVCRVYYSSTPFLTPVDGSLTSNCSSGAPNSTGFKTFGSAVIPPLDVPGVRYLRTILFGQTLLPDLRVAEYRLGNDSSVAVTAVTTGLRANISFPTGSSRAYVAVDSGGLGSPVVRRVTPSSGARTTSVLVPLPAGTGYRMRVWMVDSLSASPDAIPLVTSGGRARGLTVAASSITEVPITTQQYSLVITGDQTRPAGTVTPWTVTMFDPSRSIIAGNSCQPLNLRGSTATFTDFANLFLAVNCGATAVTDSSYVNTGTFAAALDAGVSYHQFYHQLGSFVVDGTTVQLRYYAPSSQRGESLRTLTTTAVTTGIQVALTSSMAASRYLLMVTGGAIPAGSQVAAQLTGTGMRSGSVFVPLAPASNYVVRVAAVDSMVPVNAHQIIVGSGKAEGITVGSGAPVEAAVSITPVVTTFNGPTSVFVGESGSLTVTVDDPGGVILASPYCAPLHYQINGVAPTGDQLASQTACPGKTTVSPTQAIYSPYTLPTSTAGTVHHQFVIGVPFELAPSTFFGYLISPSRTLGQPWRTLTVNPVTTGIRVNLVSPRPVSRYFVRVDSGGLATPVIRRIVTSSQSTFTDINLPPGTGYRVRVIAGDALSASPDNTPLVAALGVSSGINVSAGVLAGAAPLLREPELTVTVPGTVTSAERTVAALSAKFPIRHFRPTNTLVCNLTWSSTTFLDLVGGSSQSSVSNIPTTDSTASCAPEIPAQGVATVLRHQLWLPLEGFSVDGFTVNPRIFTPSTQRGEALRTLTVNTISTGVTVNFTSATPARRIYAIAMGGALALRQSPDSAAVAALRLAVQNDQLVPTSSGGSEVAAIGEGEVVVVLNGSGLRSGALTIPLPPGTNYDIRLVSIDSASWQNDSTNSWSWVLGGSGRQTAVTVPGTGLGSINVALSAPAISVSLPDSAFVGSAIPGSVTINDPADIYAGLSTGWAYGWTRMTPWTRNSSVTNSWGTGTSTLVSAGVRRWDFTIPAPTASGIMYSQTSVETFFRTADGRSVWLDTYDHNLAVNPSLRQTRIVEATTGIRVDVSYPTAASRVFVVVDSGGLAQPVTRRFLPAVGSRSASIPLALPVGTGYRVRVFLADSVSTSPDGAPLISLGAHARGVSVAANALTAVPLVARAATMTITAPTTRDAGSPTPFSVVVFDPTKSAATSLCRVSQLTSGAAFSDLGGTVSSLCAFTWQPDSIFTLSSNMPAALEAGVMYYRFRYAFGEFSFDGSTIPLRLVAPSSQRGEAARTLTTAAISTGMTVSITSPMAASRYLIAVSGGALPSGTHVAASVSGANMQSGSYTIPLAPGSGYQVRVAAIDANETDLWFPEIRGTATSSAVVGSGTPTTLSVAVAPASIVLVAPTSAVQGSAANATMELTDPGHLAFNGRYCLFVGFQVNGPPPTTSSRLLTRSVCAGDSWTVDGNRYTSPAVSLPTETSGTVYLQATAGADFDLPSGRVVGVFSSPAMHLGESNRTMSISPAVLASAPGSAPALRGGLTSAGSALGGPAVGERPSVTEAWVRRPSGALNASPVLSMPQLQSRTP